MKTMKLFTISVDSKVGELNWRERKVVLSKIISTW